MATERIPDLDGIDSAAYDDDSLPPITAEDIAHAVERLDAGRTTGLYEHMRTSELYVLGQLSRLGEEAYEAALRDPSQLPCLLTPTASDR